MKTLLLIGWMATWLVGSAQDSTEVPQHWLISGYIKNLESLSFDRDFANSLSGNLLHNRINVKWKPSEKWTVAAEWRNRLFWGEELKSIPGFAGRLRNANEALNLQQAWIQSGALVLHTNTERLNIEYRASKWNARLGRQRINWGMATTWNPNDLFNTYHFLDFDYEERPGMDGGRFQWLISDAASVELAYAFTGERNQPVAAAKYQLNKWGYDWQLITGRYRNQFTLGAGWAGNLGEAGFKGEAQYFFRSGDSASQFNLAIESDYMLKNGWYLRAGLLYNQAGLSRPVSNIAGFDFTISPQRLMPTRWNLILSTAKEFTPLFSANFGCLVAPGTNLLLLLPSFTYNLAANLDATLVWQSFFAEVDDRLQGLSHRAFLRLKWSF